MPSESAAAPRVPRPLARRVGVLGDDRDGETLRVLVERLRSRFHHERVAVLRCLGCDTAGEAVAVLVPAEPSRDSPAEERHLLLGEVVARAEHDRHRRHHREDVARTDDPARLLHVGRRDRTCRRPRSTALILRPNTPPLAFSRSKRAWAPSTETPNTWSLTSPATLIVVLVTPLVVLADPTRAEADPALAATSPTTEITAIHTHTFLRFTGCPLVIGSCRVRCGRGLRQGTQRAPPDPLGWLSVHRS